MIEILEERSMIGILLYLYSHKGEFTYKSDLYEHVTTNPRLSDKLDMLSSAGLVVQTPGPRRSTELNLTETGKRIAELLDVADNLMWMKDVKEW